MEREYSNIKEINECIERSDLFEIRFKNEYEELTESINSLSFGTKRPRLYFTISNFGELIHPDKDGHLRVHNYELNLENLKNIISEGINLVLCDRTGNILHNFEFVPCILEDIAERKLDYNLDNKFKTYIITISYGHIFKILEK